MTSRSWLFVPGGRPERFAKASSSGAHEVIIDLEDAVAPADKARAREDIRAWLTTGHTAWVRLNDAGNDAHQYDLEAVAGLAGLIGVVLAKVESRDQVADVVARLDVPVLGLVETALGIENVSTIAHERGIATLALGVADLRLDLGLGEDPLAWAYARSRLVVASRAAGLAAPIDGPTMFLDEAATVRRDTLRARDLGFGGKLCVHPSQVSVVNEAFRPSQDDVDWAQAVVAAAATGEAVRIDGQMIDRPRVELARRVLSEVDLEEGQQRGA